MRHQTTHSNAVNSVSKIRKHNATKLANNFESEEDRAARHFHDFVVPAPGMGPNYFRRIRV